MASRILVRPGERFNRLTVIREIDPLITPSGRGHRRFHLKCDCGNDTEALLTNLRSSSVQSCGCFNKETASETGRTHGKTKTKEFRCWGSMLSRCINPSHSEYRHYGGRGISVCEEWVDSFESFLIDIGRAPSERHQIDRANNNGNYEPSNVRWVLPKENIQNRRMSYWWVVDGERYSSCIDAATDNGVEPHVIAAWCGAWARQPTTSRGKLKKREGCFRERKYLNEEI